MSGYLLIYEYCILGSGWYIICYCIFFFSSRRRHTRCALVTGVQTCALPIWLEGRGPNFAAAFSDRRAIRVAVNQAYAQPGDPVRAGDEVAIFPPVTGG